jgi:very-short-patch-repair endonuclease
MIDQLPLLSDAFSGYRRLRSWERLSYGLHVRRGPNRTLADELRAWSVILSPSAAFTSLTAAALRGWWEPATIAHPVFVAQPKRVPRPRRAGLLVCRHPQPFSAVEVAGLRVTSAEETLLAAARDLGLLDLVILGDSALRLGHCTVAGLEAAAAQRRRGAPLLRTVIPLLDPRSESAWESVMRVLHRAAGIEVEPQHKVFDDHGRFVARGDLSVVGTKRLHEYDGDGHRDPATHADDLGRERKLLRCGWQRVGFTARHLLREAGQILAETDAVLQRSWDPARLRAWQGLIDDSLYGRAGRARAYARWRRTR